MLLAHIRIGYKYWLWELGGVYRANTWSTNNGHAAIDLLLGGTLHQHGCGYGLPERPLRP